MTTALGRLSQCPTTSCVQNLYLTPSLTLPCYDILWIENEVVYASARQMDSLNAILAFALTLLWKSELVVPPRPVKPKAKKVCGRRPHQGLLSVPSLGHGTSAVLGPSRCHTCRLYLLWANLMWARDRAGMINLLVCLLLLFSSLFMCPAWFCHTYYWWGIQWDCRKVICDTAGLFWGLNALRRKPSVPVVGTHLIQTLQKKVFSTCIPTFFPSPLRDCR